jgi:hypothetical protein
VTERYVCLALSLAALISSAGAADFANGHTRLSLDAETGRFSLYYLTGFLPLRFEPLFAHQDPRTSLLTVYFNKRVYKLGENNNFKIRLESDKLAPSLVFESPFLRVTERFEFIKTGGVSQSNGVKITFLVENTGSRQADAGLRFLLDTDLGEAGPGAPLVTDTQALNGEITFDPTSPDKWWISGNEHLSLLGSLGREAGDKPDLVHVANWTRLNDASWKLKYFEGRNFSQPNNTGDSAVAYYFEPRRIQPGEAFSVSLLLAANDPAGFIAYDVMNTLESPVVKSEPADPFTIPGFSVVSSYVSGLRADMNTLKDLLARIDRSINSDFQIGDEELLQMEEEIARLRSRYGIPEPR